jgi:hypothetical protein
MPEHAQVAVTEAEIDAALGRAREYAKYARKVVKATYSKTTNRLRLVLDDGVTCSIPRRLIQGLSGAQEKELSRIQVLSNGTGLLWPLLDVAHYVPGLLQGVYGSEKWMTALYKQRRKLRLVDATRNLERKSISAWVLDKKGEQTMSTGLDSRHRDQNGRIDEKRGDTLIRTLREEYGEDFLRDWRGNTKLSTVRKESDMSLTELVRQHQRGKK